MESLQEWYVATTHATTTNPSQGPSTNNISATLFSMRKILPTHGFSSERFCWLNFTWRKAGNQILVCIDANEKIYRKCISKTIKELLVKT